MNRVRARGFTLVTAIFLIVVLALLAGFIVTIGTVQRATSTFSFLGPRAEAAARSSIQWGITQVVATDACFPSPTTFTISGGAINGFSATLVCAATAITEGATTYNVFDLQGTASFGPADTEDYFSRSISASVTTAP